EHLVGQRVAHFALDDSRQRPRAEHAIISLRREPHAGVWRERDGDVSLGELPFELQHELLDDCLHPRRPERAECYDRIDTVAEFRAEHTLDGRLRFAGRRPAPPAARAAVIVLTRATRLTRPTGPAQPRGRTRSTCPGVGEADGRGAQLA